MLNFCECIFALLSFQENDEFFELISSKFLSETRYSTSIRAAAGRLLLCCSLTWIVRLSFHLFRFVIVNSINDAHVLLN